MRFIKALSLLLALSLVMLSLCGCSLRVGTADSLLRPPRLTGENESLQLAFEKYVGSSPSLKAPQSGDYQSSFILEDVDADGRAEALAFYLSPSDNATVRVCFLDCNESGEWRVVTDVKGSGSDVYKLEFRDVNFDGVKDVLISWSLFDNKLTRILTVYCVTAANGYVSAVTAGTSEYFSFMMLYDTDGDGISEMLLFSRNDTLEIPRYTLTLYKFNINCSLSKISEYTLNPSVMSISDVHINASSDDTAIKYILIDYLKTDSARVTDVLIFNAETAAFSPLTPPGGEELSRRVALNCSDPDGDGSYEIPVHSPLAGNTDAQTITSGASTYILDYLKFFSVSSRGLTLKYSAVYSSYASWMFIYTWRANEVTVRFLPDENNAVMFSEWNPGTGQFADDLFSIAFFPFDTPIADDYVVVGGNSLGSFAFKCTDFGFAAGINQEFIQSNLIIL